MKKLTAVKALFAPVTLGFLIGLGVVASAPVASAQLGTGGTGGTTTATSLTGDDFFIGLQATKGTNLTDYDLITYFNQANCQCGRTTYVFVALNSTTGAAKRNYITRGNVQLWAGVTCDSLTSRSIAGQCELLGSARLPELAAQGGFTVMTTAAVISKVRGTTVVTADGGVTVDPATGSADPCTSTAQISNQSLFLLIDQDDDNNFEAIATKQVPVDLTPPLAAPLNTVEGGNEALVASWTAVSATSDASGILGYQVVCKRANQYQVFDTGSYSPGYEIAATNCPDTPAAATTTPEMMDPKFLCSGLLSAAATSARIKVLQNKIFYQVQVLTIDKHKNASLSNLLEGAPVASLNFYNQYRNVDPSAPGQTPDQGKDPGGYCSVDPGGAGVRLVPLLGLGGFGIVMALRRRRRRR